MTKKPALLAAIASLALLGGCAAGAYSSSADTRATSQARIVLTATERVDGQEIFYRVAGDASKPALVLLHGFPTSSFMYREVLAELSDDYYVIAPDYPGFGNSSFPSPDAYEYTFDNIADTMDGFLEQRGIDEYALMIHDYGAPIGFRIALEHPERVTGIIAMNGNAYEAGLGEAWGPLRSYWATNDPQTGKQIAASVFTPEGMQWQYTHGTRDPGSIDPANWEQDYAKISREGQTEVQLALFYDYQNNVKAYPAWQEYLRTYQPPMLVVWGKNDAFFPVPGAEGYRRDLENVDYNILDTGHFPLEEDSEVIIPKIRAFMETL